MKGAGGQSMPLPPDMLLNALRGGTQGIQGLLAYLSGQSTGAGAQRNDRRRWQAQDAQSTPDQWGWFDWLEENYRQPGDLDRDWDDPVADYARMAPDRREVASAQGYDPVTLDSLMNNPAAVEKYGHVPQGNIRQTLEQAGWNESMGYGPQENLSTEQNKLLYSIAPKYNKERLPVPKKDPRLSSVYDPFTGMQSATNRDAYVNDTLGGGFYGGVIPEYKDVDDRVRYEIRGHNNDPHFPVISMDASGQQPDLYAGWASNQAQQFGSLPYEAFGQRVNDPRNPGVGAFAGNMVKNAAPPTWNHGNLSPYQGGAFGSNNNSGWGNTGSTPWPSSGSGKPVDWGNNGWGQSNQGTQNQGNQNIWSNQNQQQPGMGFGVSPWDNPWNMK